jgi:hypothetical protein
MPIKIIYNESRSDGAGVACNWTVPAGVTKVKFEVWGGGGSGASSASACDCCATSSPGGGGGYATGHFAVTPGEEYVICAGNAGVPLNSNCCNGGNGGNSSVTGPGISGSFCARGGLGGCGAFNFWCYQHCGCNHMYQATNDGACVPADTEGCLTSPGGSGRTGRVGSSQTSIQNVGGPAGGPFGGEGGMSLRNIGYSELSICQETANTNSWCNHILNGKIPGGCGAGYTPGCCICVPCGLPGAGGPGLVKITY